MPCETRWNSKYFLIKKFVENFNLIKTLNINLEDMDSFNDSDISTLTIILTIWKPLVQASNYLEQEDSQHHEFWLIRNNYTYWLKTSLDLKLKKDKIAIDFGKLILKNLSKYFDNEDETMTCRSNIKKVKYVKLGY